MKIILIRPNIGMLQVKQGKDIPFEDKGCMEPLQLGVLAGLTPDDIEVVLRDDRVEEIDYDEEADLVAISVEIFTARRAYEIAAAFKERGRTIVLGGIHVSSLPCEAKEFADCILIGDADFIWEEMLNDFKKNSLKEVYNSPPGVPHPGKFPRRSIYQGKKYLPISLLQYGRGCPYTCSFCSPGQYFGGNVHTRDVVEVIAEIKAQNRKLLFFVDDNVVADKEKAKKLFHALIPLKIKWMGQASLDMTADLELMKLMRKSGCIGLVIGFESVTSKGLKAYHKTPNKIIFYDEQIAIIRKHKIHIWAAFLLGHDEETKESLQRTLDFAIRNRFSFAAFNILMPYPRTPLYKKLAEENRLLFGGKWWLSDDYRFNYAAYNPKKMNPEEFTDFCFYMRKKFNSIPVICKRLTAYHNLFNLRGFWIFFKSVLLFRRESLKKQGMKLGFHRN